MNKTRLIIALPNRLLATALAQYIGAVSKDVSVCGVACNSKEIFDLLSHRQVEVLLYDPYLPGPGPEVICCRLQREFKTLKTILMKNENANGRFNEAEKCRPAAVIGSEQQPDELLELIKKVDEQHTRARGKKPSLHEQELPAQHKQDNAAALSEREKEIVNLAVRGHSCREIAFVLDISFHTARNHIRNILNKLGLSNKVQLISWYISK